MSEMEARERAGLLFRVSQLHYMIVDRNRELCDVHYPQVGVYSRAFSATARGLDTEYTENLRAQERVYFDAAKRMSLENLRNHVAILENKLEALDGILPQGNSGYIRFQSVERISTYHVDLYFNLNSSEIRMVFEIQTISNLAGNSTVLHRIEKTFTARCRVLGRNPAVDKPVHFVSRGYYYYPEQFPTGTWNLTSTGFSSDKYIQSYIATDAVNDVMTYNYQKQIIDEITKEEIQEESWSEKEIITDDGYLIHGGGYTGTEDFPSDEYDPEDNNLYTNSTWGCIRMNNDDVREIIPYIDAALLSHGRAFVHVRNGN